MDSSRKTLSLLKAFIDRCFSSTVSITADTKDFTFQPSAEFISELTSNYTSARVEKFQNGTTFSSYHVDYNIGHHKGEAIYKTTSTLYPIFAIFDSVEEYELSFSLND